jgi:hypothetical protein
MSIGQLAVASPKQTASPVILFRAVPRDVGWHLQMPGQGDNEPLLICSLKAAHENFTAVKQSVAREGRFTQRTSINESHEPSSE